MRAADVALNADPTTATRDARDKAAVDYYVALHPEASRWRSDGVGDALPSTEELRERAAVADRANKAIPYTGRIDRDPERHDDWAAALGWAQETWRAVFTDRFRAAVAALQAGDPSELEYGVRFLEADPWCFRSGYFKAKLLPAIARLELDESTRRRLARVVLAVVDDSRRRKEIRKYGSLARAVATNDLRAQLEQRATADDPQVQFNARQILERLDGN
jgi:hypothetical protein